MQANVTYFYAWRLVCVNWNHCDQNEMMVISDRNWVTTYYIPGKQVHIYIISIIHIKIPFI